MIRLPAAATAVLFLVAGFVLLVLYGPLFVAVFFSFFSFENNAVQWDSFSLDAYWSLIHDESIIDSVLNSLLVGGVAIVLALVLGTTLAFYYNGSRSRFREVLQLVIFLPFLMPPIITGLSLLVFFREVDFPRSLVTVIIGHTVFVLALAYRIILARLQTLRTSLVEASLDLGASRWQTFRYVLAPSLMSAIGSAAILAFALSFDETLITLLVTGTESTLPMRLWAMMRLGFTPDINALVTVILVATTVLSLVAIRFVKLPDQS
ncbi:MAG: ABC transporter permease [Bauldia sp.]|uniref:ABC transporter permease n=1 Tax=Bauldia sp. TaxID=2575872 RepID=UPI001DE13BBA|nr:ABC transporter permease [Bauldia sp.]MCB1495510.1 ABC transporter permease [Bauldia sp.]